MRRLSLVSSIVLALMCGTLAAESPPPFKDFSAKRVKPPAPGTKKRINIQIEPAPEVEAPQTDVAGGGVASRQAQSGRYDWFWEVVPSDLTSAGAGRLLPAMSTLNQARDPVPAPRLQSMQALAQAHGLDILHATIGTEVSPALVLAVMMTESAGRADAISSAGAEGLMQLMPDTAARFGVSDSFETQENIRGGVKYLDWLMGTFERDPILVLAGYNAGEGAVRKHEGVPPFAETRAYIPKVLAAYQVARGLCVTPPEFASDGCVFVTMQ